MEGSTRALLSCMWSQSAFRTKSWGVFGWNRWHRASRNPKKLDQWHPENPLKSSLKFIESIWIHHNPSCFLLFLHIFPRGFLASKVTESTTRLRVSGFYGRSHFGQWLATTIPWHCVVGIKKPTYHGTKQAAMVTKYGPNVQGTTCGTSLACTSELEQVWLMVNGESYSQWFKNC